MGESCYSPLVREPLSEEHARQLAGTLKAVAEPARLRLLSLIASRADGEACVCELTGAFDVSDATISHHLKVLREAGLIERERRGTWLYYRVCPETLRTIADVLMPAGAVPA
ncbi:ArsR/SmtB family transcription factor [Haloechinothrix alba]|uniref:ArsR/SmtB family transcription factor n=1 Tax=Haloechinothrix alba TaxID=664784 RepID=UPI003CCBA08E